MNNEKTIVRAVMKELTGYLRTEMPEIKQFIMQFPEANETLVYPALSMSVGTLTYTPCQPYLANQSVIASHKSRNLYVTGQYDFDPMAVDIWCRTKEERHGILDSFFKAMHKARDGEPIDEVNLKLSDYHDEWTSFTMAENRFEDEEVSSQRKEWRVTINVKVNVRAIGDESQYAMEDLECLDTNISEQIIIPGGS